MADPIDYSRSQRILFLIDLHPVLISNPRPYLEAVRAAAEAILKFPSLAASLFSFKFFYSSLPMLLYPTKPPLQLRFDQAAATLVALTEALNSMRGLENRMDGAVRCSKAVFVDSALRQVLHDYGWEVEEWDSGMELGVVRSNLVVVLSPVGYSIEWLVEFMDVGKDDEVLGSVDKFNGKFVNVFDHVRDAYVRSDIHLAWIDVKNELLSTNWDVAGDRYEFKNDFFKNGLKSLGWRLCGSDSLVLGSALVPIGLIYPLIGLSSNVENFDGSSKKCRAQLNLEIDDVKGQPLECKCCDLELTEPNLFCGNSHLFGLRGLEKGNEVSEKTFFYQTCNDTVKLHIQAVVKYSECEKMKGRLNDIVLVRELARKSSKHGIKDSDKFYADKVLKMLRFEKGDFTEMNSDPIWHILLSYLYKESSWGIVALTDGNGKSCTGILKPFTFDSAFLCVVESFSLPQLEADRLEITESGTDAGVNCHTISRDGHPNIEDNTLRLSQDGKTCRKTSRMLKGLDWTAFCKMAYQSSRIEIKDTYFTASFEKSKKLKFLQCWIKQIKRRSSNYFITNQPEQHTAPKESNDRLLQSSDGERPISSPASPSVWENSLSDSYRTQGQGAAAVVLISETPEDFLCNLSKKILDGLDNEGLDLGAFAERIVNSTAQSLRITLEKEEASGNETTSETHTDTVTSKIASELANLLLVDPKDMKTKHNSSENNKVADPSSLDNNSETIKRRYELQVLFRMEILRSVVAQSISESTKQKFVKQICIMVERIQCHLEGGFLGNWSLDSYLAKLLKSRYIHDLEDTLRQIYSKMDLLLFSEEDENLDFLLNSEDSSQSFRERLGGEAFGETNLILGPASAENKSSKRQKNKKLSLKENNSKSHVLMLAEAQEKRERARRFSSFTSWIPDLQRVWAPKQQTQLTLSQCEVSRKQSKRSRRSASLDMVFETPDSNKTPCSRRSADTPRSASRALFQDTQD